MYRFMYNKQGEYLQLYNINSNYNLSLENLLIHLQHKKLNE